MPIDPLLSAILSSVINAAIQEIAALPPPGAANVPQVGIPRVLPADLAKGELSMTGPMSASIDGKPVMLSPGVQVRDPFNMVILPSMIRGTVPVRYATDPAGNVYRLWVLSQQEATQP